LFSLNSLVKK